MDVGMGLGVGAGVGWEPHATKRTVNMIMIIKGLFMIVSQGLLPGISFPGSIVA